MGPAREIIRKLGGVPAVSAITGVHRTRVYSWMRDREAGGTGGTIPQNHIPALIDYARSEDIPLDHSDFFDVPPSQQETAGSAA